MKPRPPASTRTHTLSPPRPPSELQLAPEARDKLENQAARQEDAVAISALEGAGCDILLQRIDAMLGSDRVELDLTLDAGDGAAIAWLHRHGEVLDMHEEDGHLKLPENGRESCRERVCQYV